MRKVAKSIHRPGRRLAAVLGVLVASLAVGCSDDDDQSLAPDGGDKTEEDAGKTDSSTSDAGRADAGGEDDDEAVPSEPERWVVGGWISTEDAYTGYLTVLDDLSARGNIDLGQVQEFAGDFNYTSPGGGVVFVGLEDAPYIQRWGLDDDGKLVKEDEVSLLGRSVSSTLGGGRNVIQIIDAERAYYFDNENLQVVVFNPTTMTLGEDFSLEGLAEDGQEHALNFIHKDGDRFIITARYWSLADESSTSLVRAAIVDSTDNSVTYAEDTRCGNIAFDVTDDAGNLYLGSHAGLAVSIAAGTAGATPPTPCLLRINKGESAFDQDFFVDLAEVSGGVVGGLLQGTENHAYLFQYTGSGITADNERPTLRGDDWAVYSLDLTDAANTYAAVEGIGKFTPYGDSFSTIVDGKRAQFLVGVEADFSAGRYYEVTDPENVTEALSFASYPGHAFAIH